MEGFRVEESRWTVETKNAEVVSPKNLNFNSNRSANCWSKKKFEYHSIYSDLCGRVSGSEVEKKLTDVLTLCFCSLFLLCTSLYAAHRKVEWTRDLNHRNS